MQLWVSMHYLDYWIYYRVSASVYSSRGLRWSTLHSRQAVKLSMQLFISSMWLLTISLISSFSSLLASLLVASDRMRDSTCSYDGSSNRKQEVGHWLLEYSESQTKECRQCWSCQLRLVSPFFRINEISSCLSPRKSQRDEPMLIYYQGRILSILKFPSQENVGECWLICLLGLAPMGENFIVGNDDARYKIILVGDVSVGKTALFWRFTEGEFLAHKDTMVTTIDFKMKCINVDNKPVKLYVWDTAGSQKYRSIVSTYFKGCQGVVIVFDLSREDSFRNAIDQWYNLAKTKTPSSLFVLVGNKSDLNIAVSREQIEHWSKESHVPYIETSVKENKNISEVFDSLARRIRASENKFQKSQSVSLNKRQSTKKGCC